MGYSFNEVILCGKVTSEPDYVTTMRGLHGIKFYFGVDRITPEGKSVTDVFHVSAYGELAETIHHLCHKTTEMLIRGHLRPLSYGGGADVQADYVKVNYITPSSGCAYTRAAAKTED